MIDTGALIAYSFAIIVVLFAFRLVLIRIRVVRYIKKYHHAYWENNISFFFSGSRASIAQLTKGLIDPKIEDFKKEDLVALKQLLLAVVIMTLLVFIFIYFSGKKI